MVSKNNNANLTKNFYIYGHKRNDNNSYFYVGKGEKNESGKFFRTIYKRAHKKENRNKDWHRTIAETDYSIEILEELNCDNNTISDREKYWVKKLSNKFLVNRTVGGCGVSGYKFPQSIINKIVEKKIGKYSGRNHYLSEDVYVYFSDTGFYCGYYESLTAAANELNISRQSVKNALEDNSNYACGYLIYKTDMGDRVNPKKDNYPKNLPVGIDILDCNGKFIESFESLADLCRKCKLRNVSVAEAIKSGKIYKNLFFKKREFREKFNFKKNESKIKLIMINGTRLAGKDTLFKLFSELDPRFKRIAFADAIKKLTNNICRSIFKKNIDNLTPEEKEIFRPVLIQTGKTGRIVDENFWAKHVSDRISSCIKSNFIPVITDCRFLSEVNFYKKIYGESLIIINLTREGSPEPTEEEKIHNPQVEPLADIKFHWKSDPSLHSLRPKVKELYENLFVK